MKKRLSFIAALLVAALVSAASPVRADVVTLAPLKDNTLYQAPTGGLSNGAGQHFFGGSNMFGQIRRGLIAFDVAAAVPQGSVILDAQLTLHMSRTSGGTEFVEIHAATNNWGEGSSVAEGEEGIGAPPAPGDATWIHTFAFDQFWNLPGGDFEQQPSATALVTGDGFYAWGSTPEVVTNVQSWLDHPTHNYGWVVLGDEFAPGTAKRFDSRENVDPAVRPVLTVTYQAVPEPGAAGIMLMVAVMAGRRGVRRG